MTQGFWPEQEPLVRPEAFDPKATVLPHVEYQKDPLGWAEDKLGIPRWQLQWSLRQEYEGHVWDGDVDPLATAFDIIANHWMEYSAVGIESSTGTGKSYAIAVLILWFLASFPRSLVFTFAPKEDQLRLFIWKNIGDLWPRFVVHFPSAIKNDLNIYMEDGPQRESWAAHGYAVQIKAGERVSARASGMHAEHLLLVYEESSTIDWSVMEAGKNTCTAPHNLRIAIGNPSHQLDTLHRFCSEKKTKGLRISSYDHPNVVANDYTLIHGCISKGVIEARLDEYGATDPTFLARTRGISPEQAWNSLIRLEWLKASRARWEARRDAGTLPVVTTAKGVDVANSEHGDEACVVDVAENAVTAINAFPCPDANLLGMHIHQSLDRQRYGGPPLAAHYVGVDSIGVGAGTVNECRRLGSIVTAINNAAKPMKSTERARDGQLYEWAPDANVHLNLRSQTYWQLRIDLQNGDVDLPYDEELWEELQQVQYEDEPVTKIESKADIRARLGRSPNKADALVMANWVRPRSVPKIDVDNGEREGVSLGFDYAKHRPRQRKTAEQEMEEMFAGNTFDPLAGRNVLPHRKS